MRASVPKLARRESRKKSGTAYEARDYCFGVHEERGFRALPKRASEMGVSRNCQCRQQRQAWNTKAAAAATKNPVCKHRSLSTHPLLGTSAARHCQGPVIQGQLPWENKRCAPRLLQRLTGFCLCRLAPHSVPFPLPGLSEPQPPNQQLL